jgi:hypothetical protein
LRPRGAGHVASQQPRASGPVRVHAAAAPALAGHWHSEALAVTRRPECQWHCQWHPPGPDPAAAGEAAAAVWASLNFGLWISPRAGPPRPPPPPGLRLIRVPTQAGSLTRSLPRSQDLTLACAPAPSPRGHWHARILGRRIAVEFDSWRTLPGACWGRSATPATQPQMAVQGDGLDCIQSCHKKTQCYQQPETTLPHCY